MRSLATPIGFSLLEIMPPLAASPAGPKAGMLAFEPYIIPTIQPGTSDVTDRFEIVFGVALSVTCLDISTIA